MEDVIIVSLALITGTLISLGFFYTVYKLIKLFVDRRNVTRLPENIQNRLNELEQNNRYLEKRIRNLEAITTDDDFTPQNESVDSSSVTHQETGGKLQNTLRSRS